MTLHTNIAYSPTRPEFWLTRPLDGPKVTISNEKQYAAAVKAFEAAGTVDRRLALAMLILAYTRAEFMPSPGYKHNFGVGHLHDTSRQSINFWLDASNYSDNDAFRNMAEYKAGSQAYIDGSERVRDKVYHMIISFQKQLFRKDS